MRKAIIFIWGASVATQMTNCVTQLQAMKMSYKHVIYDSAEAKHYLDRAMAIPSTIGDNVTNFKKTYEDTVYNAKFIPYYQNQYFRSELYNLAQSKKMSPEEIKPLLKQIDERIDALVEKYAEKIYWFEKTNSYYADNIDAAMKQLARSSELNEWLKGIRKSEFQEDLNHDKSSAKRRHRPVIGGDAGVQKANRPK